jgi:hypothetical protein
VSQNENFSKTEMKSAGIVIDKAKLGIILIAVLVTLVADPLGVLKGNFSQDSYSEMRDELSKIPNAKVLLVGSWDDFYSLEYNSYWRTEISEEFVERTYDEVLDAASLGNLYFNSYLQSREISHILVPRSTFDLGVIRHKFTNRGSVEIELGDPFFKMVATKNGPYESVLLEVVNTQNPPANPKEIKYELSWKNTDWWFYTKQTKITEVGLYKLSYIPFYEWGPDVSWYFDLSPERPDFLELQFNSLTETLNRVDIELTLISAYGANAPPHEVWVSAENYSETEVLSPSSPGVFNVTLESGETIKIRNLTPCRLPRSFEPSDLSEFKICFGVSKVLISPEFQEE